MSDPLFQNFGQKLRDLPRVVPESIAQRPPASRPPSSRRQKRVLDRVAAKPRAVSEPEDYSEEDEETPSSSSIEEDRTRRKRSSRRRRGESGWTPKQILIGALLVLLGAAIIGAILYAVLRDLHSDGSRDGSDSGAGPASVQMLGHHQEGPLVHYNQPDVNAQPGASGEVNSVHSIGYSFTLGQELQTLERHPAAGSLGGIAYEGLRSYSVCCGVKSKSFICAGGASYSARGSFFEASLEFDPHTQDVYLAVYVNGVDLLGAGCYANIYYTP